MPFETPHKKYLQLADACVGFRDKVVLEVGGCSPPDLILRSRAARWTCVNLDSKAVDDFNARAGALGASHCRAHYQDVATFESDAPVDVIYSINSFEHISNLELAFDRMYRALKPGGRLFTLFGPLWSSDVGHHLSIPTKNGPLHFFDGVLEPWEHLTSTPDAIRAKLEARFGPETAERALNFIYTYPDLNRLFEHQYLGMVRKSGLTPVLILRNKKGTPPRVPGATSTREFLMILKKGSSGPLERASSLVKFGWTYLRAA